MEKQKRIILIIVFVLLTLGGGAIYKMTIDGDLKWGEPDADFISLINGSYEIKNLELQADTYAIYARVGFGIVTIGGEHYELNSSLFKDVSSKTMAIPSATYSVIYGESPKVTITDSTVIVVEGEDDFEISFIRH